MIEGDDGDTARQSGRQTERKMELEWSYKTDRLMEQDWIHDGKEDKQMDKHTQTDK